MEWAGARRHNRAREQGEMFEHKLGRRVVEAAGYVREEYYRSAHMERWRRRVEAFWMARYI